MTEPTPPAEAGQLTQLLEAASNGNVEALNRLFPLVYDELRRIATRQLRSEREGHTLSTTALVREAYLKLVDQTRVQWRSRAHFCAVASHAMRRILINYGERGKAGKRGGGIVPVTPAGACDGRDPHAAGRSKRRGQSRGEPRAGEFRAV